MVSKILDWLASFWDPYGLRSRETPIAEVTHPALGVLNWSKDDGAWCGFYRSFDFTLEYDGQGSPSEALTAYAVEVLDDPDWLDATFEAAKDEAIRTHYGHFTEEIRSLTLGTFHFFRNQRGGWRILADVDGGRDYKLWRIEYEGRHCLGIGWDD